MALSLVALVSAVALVGALLTWLGQQTDGYRQPVRAPLVAPPGPGAAVPAIDPDLPAADQSALGNWATQLSATVPVSARALQAYGYAAARTAGASPGCGLGWTTLAGIGAVESRHGSYGGARLDERGRALPPIVGVPLNGGPGVADVPDTDDGALDGDPTHDRAVGPMQFIPQTWQQWGIDADGDGVADPNNLNDAALTAARYLCAGGRDLRTEDGWRAALFSYNRSRTYADSVLRYAIDYAAGRNG